MILDFRDFSNKTVNDFKKKAEEFKKDFKEESKEEFNSYEEAYNKYSGMQGSDLMKEFLKMAEEKKKDGSLNDGKIRDLYNSLAPMMGEEEKARLEDILNLIKK